MPTLTVKEQQQREFLSEYSPALELALNTHKNHKDKYLTFVRRSYLKAIYLADNPYIVIKKSTQCGITEWLMILTISKAMAGRSVFYVLPNWGLMSRFVKNRLDRSIMYTPFYAAQYLAEAQKRRGLGYIGMTSSMSLKHFGAGSIAFVGSQTSAVFTEYPADDLIIDELDECDQANLAMGVERLSDSEDRRQIKVGNPTIENFGIDREYRKTNMLEWFLRCGVCGHYFKPDWFHHVVRKIDENNYMIRDKSWERGMERDIHLICDKCNRPVDRFMEGSWEEQNPYSDRLGMHVSKLFSTHVTIKEILERFEEGLVNDDVLTRVYNGDFGLAFTAEGAKITEGMLDECRCDYRMEKPTSGACFMGIDVGNMLNVIIAKYLPDNRMRVVYIGTVEHYADIAKLHKDYRVRVGVVDAQPETRLSRRITKSLRGMFRCYYAKVKRDVIDPKNKIITVDRTQALDQVKEVILMKEIELPINARSIIDFYSHMTAAVRIYNREKEEYSWVEGEQKDHYHHSMCYLLISRRVIKAVGR